MRPRPGLVLALLAFSSTLLAAQIPVAEPGIVPAPGLSSRFEPRVFAGGDTFLVTWEERILARNPGGLYVRAYDALRRPRQPIATLIDRGFDAHAVWTGGEFLVVYVQRDSLLVAPRIRAVRVTADGSIVEGSQVTFREAKSDGRVHALAWNGTVALAAVLYDGTTRMLTLDREAHVLRNEPASEAPAALAPAGDGFFLLARNEGDAVATNGSVFSVVENTSLGVIATIMRANHTVVEAFLLVSDGTSARQIAWDGSAWVTAYTRSGSVCTARFTTANDVARSCNGETTAATPAVAAFDGRSFAAWSRQGHQIFTDGGIASEVPAMQLEPAATLDANGLLAVWLEGSYAIRIGGITPDGSRRRVRTIERAEEVNAPRVANAGAYSLLVWIEGSSGHEVWASRIDTEGTPVPPLMRLGSGTSPNVVSNGRDWVVVWNDSAEIVSALVTRDSIIDQVHRYGASGTSQFGPVAGATANGFVIAWHEVEGLSSGGVAERIVTEELRADGSRTTGGVRVVDRLTSYGFVHGGTLGIGCRAGSCLVTWHESGSGIAQRMGMTVGADARARSELRKLAESSAGVCRLKSGPRTWLPVRAGDCSFCRSATATPWQSVPRRSRSSTTRAWA